MNLFKKESYIFFLLTYMFIAIWLYKGITVAYTFCLTNHSYINIFGLLAGITGILTIPSYITHQKGTMRIIGIFTLIIGVSTALIVCYRFFVGPMICQ
jgi:uncharacterized membrane protein HdeD (DUF308 family)